MQLVFPAPAYSQLTTDLLVDSRESAAILLTQHVERGSSERVLVVGKLMPTTVDYRRRNTASVTLEPSFVLSAVRQAQANRLGVVFVHTHPFDDFPAFSAVDDAGEVALAEFTRLFLPAVPAVALVIGKAGCSARLLGTSRPIPVHEIGVRRHVWSRTSSASPSSIDDRQVRALGTTGQQVLRDLSVAVVGVGGTGSLVAQQLAHLGVARITLIDDDLVEGTNINRVVGVTSSDIGLPKVTVLARTLGSVRPDVNIRPLFGSVLDSHVAELLAASDFVFCCTDTHGSRAVVGQSSYQYLVPTIDIGIVLRTDGATLTHIAGRVHYLCPQTGCLVCAGVLDPHQVRRDFMSSAARKQDPYFIGDGEPQPAVIAFNSVVAGSAVAMFLRVITGVGTQAAMLNYDGIHGTVRAAVPRRDAYCVICTYGGALAVGDSMPLPSRAQEA